MKIPTRDLEFWLLGWGESHSGGCKVTFQVSEQDLEYFKAATIRKGKHAGQRYAAVLVQLNDDETPDPESVKPKDPLNRPAPVAAEEKKPATKAQSRFPGGLCGLAVKWCADPVFHDWVNGRFSESWAARVEGALEDMSDEEITTSIVKSVCGMTSRKELTPGSKAAHLFESQIRAPYMDHLEELAKE